MKAPYLFLLISAVIFLFKIVCVWVNPWRLRWRLEKQGIRGPKPCFLYGNVPEMQRIQASSINNTGAENTGFVAHNYTSTLFPYFEQWRKQYALNMNGRLKDGILNSINSDTVQNNLFLSAFKQGPRPIYTYSTGNKQHLYVNHPELVKEMNQSTSLDLGKPSYVTKRLAPMLGNGILRSNGRTWAQQRKIVAPEFFMDKVKGMVGLMLESAKTLTSKWEGCIESQGGIMAEIKAEEYLRCLSGDVISKACFGGSYTKGKEIFSKLRALQKAISNQCFLFGFHTFGLLPSEQQKKVENLEKEIEALILEAVNERERECIETSSFEKDLLQLILEGAINDVGKDSSKKFIVDNCKNIYFAGHESTAVAASWCLILLALYPEWQARIREEIAQVCSDGGQIDADSLPKLKTVTMVIQEVLRLYPPAAFVSREALQETQIGHIVVPKGVCLWTLIPTLHRDPEIWGTDANEFNPQRFANGILKACKLPQVYIPFGLGPRLCLGKNFAMVQLKIVISLIISNFIISLSPKYKHSPAYRMIVEPGQGVNLLIQRSSN